MNNNPIQSLWIGNALSPMEVLCVRSFLAHGHDFHLYVYDHVANIPERTTIMDANRIIPKDKVYIDSFGSYANIANQFRFLMLYKIGGWWVDMDSVCLKPFDFDDEYVFSSETVDPYNRCLANIGYIKCPPGAKLLMDCLQFQEERKRDHIHWGELGVNLFSRMIFRNGLGNHVRPPECFCPVSPYQMIHLIADSEIQIPESAYAVHLWHELWRRKKLDKWGRFPAGSLYERLKREYGIAESQ